MVKCVICGKEWEWCEWEKGGKIVEPGMSLCSMEGINVCMDCKPIVYKFHERIENNKRELRSIMEEWYRVKKFVD